MENTDEILEVLERFTDQKAKQIPKKLDDYLEYVAKTGDSVFGWSNIKYLLREKLLHAIKNFNENIARIEDVPSYPNVDPFNFETMESMLLERFELFNAAPFTIQRLCELLVEPRKHYSRIDKYMRALEKNILVVTTVEPGRMREEETANGDIFDGLDVDIELDEQEEQRVIEIAQKILVENKLRTADEATKHRATEYEQEKQDQEPEVDEQQPKLKKPKLANEANPELNATETIKETLVKEANEILHESTNKTHKPEEKLENIHSEKQATEAEKNPTSDDEAAEINSTSKNVEAEILEEAENIHKRNEHQSPEDNESVENTGEVSLNTQKAEQTYIEKSSNSINQVVEKEIDETSQLHDVAVDQEQIPTEESPTYSEITTEIDVVPECKETVLTVTKLDEEIAGEDSSIVTSTLIEPEKEVEVVEPMEADESEDIVKDKSLDIAHVGAMANTNMDVDRDDVGQQQDEPMDVGNVK